MHLLEGEHPSGTRPRGAIEAARAWADGSVQVLDARAPPQRERLPERTRALVLEGRVRRDAICWSAFDD
ncbi:hypothetical protein [Kineococcus sp. SYSU DK006]|uniref:hypothetical protein n=1 Tax=Kineococcus sp. SYSU DK006 TaxID=3383127 RepID=UPI003D7EFC4B